ncbi:MAG: outer membrane lipoprotein-sorting protein [Syntrophothermus sp.]
MRRLATVTAIILLTILILPAYSPQAAALTADEILNRVDENMYAKSSVIEAEMTITYKDRVVKKQLHIENEGKDKAYSEFLAPERDKGIKYLRLGDNLWMYHPGVNRVINIAGHQLRQSANGSDFSYEDMMERSKKLQDRYTAQIAGNEQLGGRPSIVLDLEAKVSGITYYRIKMWVDSEYFIALREEYYAKSGKLLKYLQNGDIQKYGSRYYPIRITVKDVIRDASTTEMVLKKVQFDVPLGENAFSRDRLH